jgi:hypothetical protein
MGMADRRRVQPRSHEAGRMGDVGHQESTDFVRNLPEARVIDMPAVRARAGDDDRGADFPGDSRGIVLIDQAGRLIQRVEMGIEQAT